MWSAPEQKEETLSLPRFPTQPAAKTPSPILTEPPGPWPADPALSRRVAEARRRLDHTRKALARHAPAENRHGASAPKGRKLKTGPRSATLTAAGSRSDPRSRPLPPANDAVSPDLAKRLCSRNARS